MSALIKALITTFVITGAFSLFTSCCKYPSITYLINGNEVTCKQHVRQNCGLSLYQCDNGITYQCLTNVQVIREVKE